MAMQKEVIYSVLIVSANDKFTDSVLSFLPDSGFGPKRAVRNVAMADLGDRVREVRVGLPVEIGCDTVSVQRVSRPTSDSSAHVRAGVGGTEPVVVLLRYSVKDAPSGDSTTIDSDAST